MKKVRGAMAVGLAALRDARTEEAVLEALRRIDIPAERGGSRLEPKRILACLRSESPAVRERALRVLGNFSANQVLPAIMPCLNDPEPEVGAAAVGALVRLFGVRNAASSIGDDAPEHVLVRLLAEIEFGSRESRPRVLIERFVDHPSEPIRAEARDVRERLGAL